MKFYKEVNAIQFDGTQGGLLKVIEELDLPMDKFHIGLVDSFIIHLPQGSVEIMKGDWIVMDDGKLSRVSSKEFSAKYIPILEIEASTLTADFNMDELYCPGCGKPKVLCLNDTTGCGKHG